MAILSFTRAVNLDADPTSTARKLIDKGSYNAQIINAKIHHSEINNKDTYNITWRLSDGEITKWFNLWDADDNYRLYAQRDLMKLFKILEVNTFENGDNSEIEDDILIGKENGLIINHKTKATGEVFAYIESFFKIKQSPGSTMPDDSLVF